MTETSAEAGAGTTGTGAEPGAGRIVIENCAVATVDAAGTEYGTGHIVVAGNVIESVGAGPAPPVSPV